MRIENLSVEQLNALKLQIENRLENIVLPYTFDEIVNEALVKFEEYPIDEDDIKESLLELYRDGYISYPLTDTAHLPASMYELSHTRILIALQNRMEKHPLRKLNAIDLFNKPLAFVNNDMQHHGIIPEVSILDKTLSDLQFWLLRKISKRYIDIFIKED